MYINVSLPARKTYCVCFSGNNIDATSRMGVSDISGEDKRDEVYQDSTLQRVL